MKILLATATILACFSLPEAQAQDLGALTGKCFVKVHSASRFF